MAKRRAPARKSNRQKQSGSGMVTWLGILALSVGAIWAYENRARFFGEPRQVASAKVQNSNSLSLPKDVPVPLKAPAQERVVKAQHTSQPSQNAQREQQKAAPVPPKPIPASGQKDAVAQLITAAVPGDRPLNAPAPQVALVAPAAATSEPQTRVEPKSQQFSFCGRSGLKNCVEDGRVFWRDGKKHILAGITVARTDEAACVEERRKGFAAKVRLRDFLNGGAFVQSAGANGLSVSRNGMRFEEQLLREGLAMPLAQKNQSWCG